LKFADGNLPLSIPQGKILTIELE